MNMASYSGFRRQAVPAQVAQQLQTVTIPAPTRGIILNENESFMQPGGALVLDNWKPTMKGSAIRGGCRRWCDLHGLDAPSWANATLYNTLGVTRYDPQLNTFWKVAVSHTSAATGTFAADRTAHPTFWTNADLTVTRLPVVSMFTFIGGDTTQRMYAGQTTKLFDVTSSVPTLIKSGQASGNYVASQLANQGGDHMLVCNDAGDYVLHFDGTTWTTLNAGQINAASGSVTAGHNLTYVWKYRNRYFFIEGGTMNAWYLPTNAFQGTLLPIPLAGAATKGGHLLCGFTWSIDAGDGIDDKNVFMTSEGELLIFTGSDPSVATNWRQEGRYATSYPLGMNCHTPIGGDVLIATVDGIIPISASIQKDTSQLELAAITRPIKPMWRNEVNAKRALPWTMLKWDEYGALFVSWPGGNPGAYTMGAVNLATGAWARFTGWDAMCFGRLRADAFFGRQDGIVMQCDRTGTDDSLPYTCTMVGGWEMFNSSGTTVVWRQARASFAARAGEPFQPQLSATTDYVITIPPAPTAAPDPGPLDVWDQGLWAPTPGWTPPWSLANPLPTQTAPSAPDQLAYLQWDQPAQTTPTVRNTGWVSIGYTGFSHAPIVQVTIAQQAIPDIELISIAATYDGAGVNV